MCFFYPEEELTKLKASKVNEPIQEEESGDAMLEQGTQVRSSVPIVKKVVYACKRNELGLEVGGHGVQ